MQDPFPFPSCFSSSNDDLPSEAVATKSGQSVVFSVYRTKIAGHCRLITVTWCRNLLVHGLSVSVEGSETEKDTTNIITTTPTGTSTKVELVLRPWNFWRRQGSKRFHVGGKPVDVFWDLRAAKFSGDPEPSSGYYVAVISDDEVVLLLGDLKKDAFRRSGSRPSAIDAILVSKKEHVFGKKKFTTKAKFEERGKPHDISIECSNGNGNGNSSSSGTSALDPEMVIKVDGHEAIHVKHLQWKFRGNGTIYINKVKVEVYWDVHDWLFGPGLRHALFIFKPTAPPPPPPQSPAALSSSPMAASVDVLGDGSSDYCFFLYAWKVE